MDETRHELAAICCGALSRQQTRIGDLTYAAYSCDQLNTNMLAAGDSLVEAQREFENGLAFARKVRFGLVIDLISAELGLVRTLRGLTRDVRLL